MPVQLAIYDPFPGRFETSGAGHLGHKPKTGNFGHALAYYAWTKGPLGLLDPGNVIELNYWAQRYGWKGAAALTVTRATILPIMYGIMFDPDHVWDSGLDDSYLGIADDRRRTGGNPLLHQGYVGSAEAWQPWSRAV